MTRFRSWLLSGSLCRLTPRLGTSTCSPCAPSCDNGCICDCVGRNPFCCGPKLRSSCSTRSGRLLVVEAIVVVFAELFAIRWAYRCSNFDIPLRHCTAALPPSQLRLPPSRWLCLVACPHWRGFLTGDSIDSFWKWYGIRCEGKVLKMV